MVKLLAWIIISVIVFAIVVNTNSQFIVDIKENVKEFDIGTKIQNIKLPRLGSCPQIDVSMSDLDIDGKTYDGWTITGKGNCRKGTEEGENVNMYYCGGYSYGGLFNIGEVNVYVEKTFISDGGNIKKTSKYVIWNIYDENGDFVETKCLGNPDDFYDKQAEDFARQFEKLP